MEKEIIGLSEIKNIVEGFAKSNAAPAERIDFVVGISRGGLIPAALLAARINKPLVAVYIDKNDKIYFDRPEWIKNKNVLVVDDIIRSGKTLKLLKDHLKINSKPASISFFTLFRVVPLARSQYFVEAFAKEVDSDIVFPWDNN